MGMIKANVAMDRFMKKLENDEFVKVIQPNNGPDLTPEFIEEQVQLFTGLLQTGLLEAAVNEGSK